MQDFWQYMFFSSWAFAACSYFSYNKGYKTGSIHAYDQGVSDVLYDMKERGIIEDFNYGEETD